MVLRVCPWMTYQGRWVYQKKHFTNILITKTDLVDKVLMAFIQKDEQVYSKCERTSKKCHR